MALPIEIDDDFWEDLIPLIKGGRVIPVAGQRMVTYGDQNKLLYSWLAQKLAENLNVPADRLPITTIKRTARESFIGLWSIRSNRLKSFKSFLERFRPLFSAAFYGKNLAVLVRRQPKMMVHATWS